MTRMECSIRHVISEICQYELTFGGQYNVSAAAEHDKPKLWRFVICKLAVSRWRHSQLPVHFNDGIYNHFSWFNNHHCLQSLFKNVKWELSEVLLTSNFICHNKKCQAHANITIILRYGHNS